MKSILLFKKIFKNFKQMFSAIHIGQHNFEKVGVPPPQTEPTSSESNIEFQSPQLIQ